MPKLFHVFQSPRASIETLTSVNSLSLHDVSLEPKWDDDPKWSERDPPTCDEEPLGPPKLKEPDSLDDIDEEAAWVKDRLWPEELEMLPEWVDDIGPLLKEPELEEEYEEDWAEAKEELPS